MQFKIKVNKITCTHKKIKILVHGKSSISCNFLKHAIAHLNSKSSNQNQDPT